MSRVYVFLRWVAACGLLASLPAGFTDKVAGAVSYVLLIVAASLCVVLPTLLDEEGGGR